jgi:hypothetical protein
MLTNFDKAWMPLVLAVLGVLVYQGVLTKENADVLGSVTVPAIFAALQAVLVWFIPNKGGGS